MKHLFNFDTLTEYNDVKDTLEKPYVVTIDENNSLKYNTDVIRVPEGNSSFKDYYFDVTNVTSDDLSYAIINCVAFNYSEDGACAIYGHSSTLEIDMETLTKAVTKVMFITGIPIMINGEYTAIIDEDFLEQLITAGGIPITKEEFYTL